MLGEDLVGRHPVRDHRHNRGNRKAQPPDARQPAHYGGVGGDAFVGHMFMLAASGGAAQTTPDTEQGQVRDYRVHGGNC